MQELGIAPPGAALSLGSHAPAVPRVPGVGALALAGIAPTREA